MASRRQPPWKRTELETPSATGTSVPRTFEGYQAALATRTIPELLELAAKQAALLEQDRHRVMLELISASQHSSLDLPVVRSTPTELPSPSERARDERPSRSPQPSPFELLSTAGRLGPRLAGALLRATRNERRR